MSSPSPSPLDLKKAKEALVYLFSLGKDRAKCKKVIKEIREEHKKASNG